ncbi:hypothetical protein [Paenibacillus sp. FSL H8-0537]|uniref:hypothetical protein n=1 Tax=Paenibacillus sp. FSL H8-0537 TaxID=2921399 RepID=UPI003100E524
MQSAIITFIINSGQAETVQDLEVSLGITLKQLLVILQTAYLLPDQHQFKCEFSSTGEEWNSLEEDERLSNVIFGDGSLIRIILI